MTSLAELQTRVAAWSRSNFGEQTSKYDGTVYGHLLPLIGVAEEFFEGQIALDEYDDAQVDDSVADIIIYLCDFTHRLGIPLKDNWYTYRCPLDKAFKNLFHSTLKMHQGIRGFEDKEYALKEISISAHCIISALQNEDFVDPVELATNTFNKIVSKRNWVTDPKTAGDA